MAGDRPGVEVAAVVLHDDGRDRVRECSTAVDVEAGVAEQLRAGELVEQPLQLDPDPRGLEYAGRTSK